jgi:hypothetical protein
MATSFVVNLVAFVIGLQWGIVGVAAGYAISSTLVGVAYAGLVARMIGANPWSLVRQFAGIAQAVVGMVAFALLTREVLEHLEAGAVVTVIATFFVGATTYALLCRWRTPDVIEDIRRLASRGMRTRNLAPPPSSEPAGFRESSRGSEGPTPAGGFGEGTS